MSIFFVFLYTFFKKHTKILVLLLLVILGISVYFVSKIKLEEDISKTTAVSNKTINAVLKQSKLTNKVIINVSLSKPDATGNPEILQSIADELVDSLHTHNFKPYISDITYKIHDSIITGMMDIFVGNLPVFLEDNDYKRIDNLITASSIAASIDNNYRSLISPSGFMMKKFIMQDPVGICSLAFSKLKQLQFDETYEIQDGYIFTNDRKHLFIFINPSFESSRTAENSLFIKKLDTLISAITTKTNNTISTEYFGGIAVAAGNAEQIKKDVLLTVFISMLIIFVFVAWFFKRISIPFISFLPALFGGAIALAILFMIRTNISVIALAIGSVLLGIIVDYSLYIFSLYRTKKSFTAVIKDMSVTIALCAITSATAFFSLLFLQSEVLRDLGLFTGISILGAALFALIVLPHTIGSKDMLADSSNRKTFIDNIANYSFESNRIVAGIIVVISIVFLCMSKHVAFETDMYKMNFVSEKLQKAEQHLNDINKTSLKSIYLVSTGKNLNEALANDNAASVALADLKSQHIIKKYSSISSILVNDSIQRSRIVKWNNYWTEEKKSALKQLVIANGNKYGFTDDAFNEFYQLLNKHFEPITKKVSRNIQAQFLSDRIIQTKDNTLVVSLIKADDRNRNTIFAAFKNNAKTIAFDKQGITSGFVKNIQSDFELLVNLCLIFVTLVLIISFGRIEIGLIAALPMFVSWWWTLGIMNLFGLTFNIFNIIISTFIFGLGVDYSILMIQGLIQEFRYGNKELPSYKTSIFLSVFTTIVGVGVLILAKHPALHSMAVISVIGLISVVIVAYTLEPICFKFLTTIKSKKRKLPVTFVDIIFTAIAFGIFFTGCLVMNLVLPIVLILPTKKKHKKFVMHYIMMLLCKFEIYFMFNVKKCIINESGEAFKKPAIILANHQSHIDLLFLLMLNPKIIVITNNWVWNNPIYSFVIRYIDFYSINEGHELLVENLQARIAEGYSILMFPEGSRSEDTTIKRFHKGAFLLAQQLEIDILPIIIHGLGDCMTKGENYLKNGSITMKIYHRITPHDTNFGTNYHDKTKAVQQFFRCEYEKIVEQYATPRYYRTKLVKNYIYKGPFLEWYMRIKVQLENNYELFNTIIPRQASIMDIGCGYGFLVYMLHFVSNKRTITGIDYDSEKIAVANNCISKTEQITFVATDALEYNYTPKDVFLLNDILHYITPEKQEKLIALCIQNLTANGIIIIRDADSNLKQRHWGTRYTEFFSTTFGFNKMGEERLFFTSGTVIKEIASKHGMCVESIDETKLTSNIIYVLRKQPI